LESSEIIAGPTEIARPIGSPVDNVKALLTKMHDDKQVRKFGKGKYSAIKAKDVFKNL